MSSAPRTSLEQCGSSSGTNQFERSASIHPAQYSEARIRIGRGTSTKAMGSLAIVLQLSYQATLRAWSVKRRPIKIEGIIGAMYPSILIGRLLTLHARNVA